MSESVMSQSRSPANRDRARQQRADTNLFANHAAPESLRSLTPHQSVASPSAGSDHGPSLGQAPADSEAELEVVSAFESTTESDQEEVLLDAYWGSFGNPVTRELARNTREVVIGVDDRQQIRQTNSYPWCAIASLELHAADGARYIGTGWMVSPRLMLTAAHCVYISDHGGWVQQIKVMPGRNGSDLPFESCIATDYRAVSGWIQDGNRDYDYAAILLPENCRYGERTGWFGYDNLTDDALDQRMINVSGYPGDKPRGTQWFHANRLSSVSDRVLTYEADTAGGQSGAPVWIKNSEGDRYGVGIHTNGSLSGNSATRINAEVMQNINAWRALVP